MALTRATPRTFGQSPALEIETDEVLDATSNVYAGAYLVKDTTDGGVIAHPGGTLTSGFAGIAIDGNVINGTRVANAQIKMATRGSILETVVGTVSQASKDATVYVDDDDTLTLTSTDNTPMGKITKVVATGAVNTNKVWIAFEADGHTSR